MNYNDKLDELLSITNDKQPEKLTKLKMHYIMVIITHLVILPLIISFIFVTISLTVVNCHMPPILSAITSAVLVSFIYIVVFIFNMRYNVVDNEIVYYFIDYLDVIHYYEISNKDKKCARYKVYQAYKILKGDLK